MLNFIFEIIEEIVDEGLEMTGNVFNWVTGEGYPDPNVDNDDDDEYKAALRKERQRKIKASKERFRKDIKDILDSTVEKLNGTATIKLVNSQSELFESCTSEEILALKNLISTKSLNLPAFKRSCDKNGIPLIDFSKWSKEVAKTKSEIREIEQLLDKVAGSLSESNFNWRRRFPIAASKCWVGEDMISNIQELIDAAEGTGNIKLVICGLLKAGKSTFMNCITGHHEKELFHTDDIRATIKNQSFVKDGVEYIDTPGIDAEGRDEKEALNALKNADCVIFAHNLSDGELNIEERVFLEKIAKNFRGKSGFLGKCLLLLTRLDKKSTEEAIRVEEKVQKQLNEIFGERIESALISSTRYSKGIIEEKEVLVKRSGYLECLDSLGRKIDFCREDATRERKRRLIQEVKRVKKQLNKLIKERKNTDKEFHNRLNTVLSDANLLIIERTSACVQELNSIKQHSVF